MPDRQALVHLPACAVLALALLAAPPARAQEPAVVRLGTNVERSYFPPAEALLRKAYASLGLQVEFLPWPLLRTQAELRNGRLDGVAMRSDVYFEQTPFLRRVDVPLLQLQVFAYARPPCPQALTPEELGKSRVSYQRGMVAAEALVPEAARVPANTPSDAFLNLGAGAADYALVLTTAWMAEVPVDTRQGAICRIPTPLTPQPALPRRARVARGLGGAAGAGTAPHARPRRDPAGLGRLRTPDRRRQQPPAGPAGPQPGRHAGSARICASTATAMTAGCLPATPGTPMGQTTWRHSASAKPRTSSR